MYEENTENMSDGRKQILSPFTEHKKQKAWNKAGEKYIRVATDVFD